MDDLERDQLVVLFVHARDEVQASIAERKTRDRTDEQNNTGIGVSVSDTPFEDDLLVFPLEEVTQLLWSTKAHLADFADDLLFVLRRIGRVPLRQPALALTAHE